MTEKILATHRERTAYVYVRQSTMHQVRHNQESQQRQYELPDRARQLGFGQVVVIDEDLGRSGSGSMERPGFARLVGTVCRGEVGAVLAIEASRLARNNRDWHHLIDLCAMTETLLIDHDGIYDPRQINDRLLLGLKGTMSEFELSLLRQRAQESLRRMIGRGEVLSLVPIGYVRTKDNRIEMTPDLQIQDAIRGVFAKFRELGSARQVLLWYRQNEVPLPTLAQECGFEVVWRPPVYNRVLSILKSPVYAGAFVYGRRQTRTIVVDGRARRTQGHNVPTERWMVCLKDHHAAYTSWDTYVQNQRQIEGNLNKDPRRGALGTGTARNGRALLAGLLRCRRCGRKLHVAYSGVGGRIQRYHCHGGNISHGVGKCIGFGGLRVDQAVSEHVLEILQPLGVQAALDAVEQMRQGEDQKRRSLRLAIEKARYEVDRARRQYDASEPENRLVAAELEKRWEDALQHVHELEAGLEREQTIPPPVTEQDRERLLAMGEDLRHLWHHPSASPAIKKRILRTVLEEILVDVSDDPPELRMLLHWAGGVHSPLVVLRARTGEHRHCTDRKVVDLVGDLAKVCDDGAIAAVLNRLGYRTGADNTWTESRVRSLRDSKKIPACERDGLRTLLTMADAARELGVSREVVRRLLKQRILPGRQPATGTPWLIERQALALPHLQAAVKAAREGRRSPCEIDCKSQVKLFQELSEV